MTRADAHHRGLLAAAHIVLVAPQLSCAPQRGTVPATPAVEEHSVADADTEPVHVATSPALHVGAQTCEVVLDESFPGPDTYLGRRRDVSVRVQDCCMQHLADRLHQTHHWACCESLEGVAGVDPLLTQGCTPWGPPPPPAMPKGVLA